MVTAEKAGSKTNVAFWDAQWSARSQTSRLANWLRSADFGKRGIFLRAMSRHVPGIFNAVHVVELGGASSRFAIDLAKFTSSRVTIVDNSEVGIEMSKRLFADENVNIKTVFADIFDLAEMDGKYDVVTHWGLMEHFDDPKSIFDISAQLLKPGGKLVYTMPNMKAVGAGLWKRHAPSNFSAHIFHSDETLQHSAKSAGFGSHKTFHFGVPLVRMAPAEQMSFSAAAANAAHAGMLAAGVMMPRLFTSVSPQLASARGFVLQKID